MAIKNIIFDLGGVLVDLDFQKTAKAFKQLGVVNFDSVFSRCKQDRLIDEFELGQLSPQVFREKVKVHFNLNIADTEFDTAFNAMLIDLPKQRLDFVKSLRNEYKTFLLSNSNEIHTKKITEMCHAKHGVNSFKEYFDKEYYSHQIQKRKPSPETFLTLLDENNLQKSETLFVDDTLDFVLAAKNMGLHAMHIGDDEDVLEVMECIQYIK